MLLRVTGILIVDTDEVQEPLVFLNVKRPQKDWNPDGVPPLVASDEPNCIILRIRSDETVKVAVA